ncbi:uncharacterized protein C8orf88 homolog isoform X3 [Engystomops pustulosus]|uniref:uncharacterized protein C8orf88 homolog isoform X3 n=1 Tax=Engystomops pustulosus TaxID=76066 RepID=UPI003AFB360B
MRLLGSSHAPCDEAGVSSPPGSGQPVQVRCGAMHAYVGRISRHHEVMTPHKGDCELLLSNEMEDRRFLRKSLQPARPIRRTLPDTGTKFMVNIQAKFTDNYRDSNCNLLCAIGNNHHVFKDPVPEKPTEESPVNTNKDCELLLSNEMEDRRFLRKPLQPARPIRRTLPDTGTKFMVNIQAKFTDNYRDSNCNLLCAIGNNHHVFKDLVPEKPTEEPSVNTNKDRITYSRDLLLQLSNLSVSKQKPKYLPDLPIIRQHPGSSLRRVSDIFLPDYMQDTNPAARPDHHSYHLSDNDSLISAL